MVHAAMHDAVQAYDRRFESYAGAIPGATGSPVVAAAKAAHDVLAGRFPSRAANLAALYSAYLGELGLDPSSSDVAGGEAAGAQAAFNVIAVRAGDGSFPATFQQFTGGPRPGEWVPNPGTPGMVSPWARSVRPFTLDSLGRCQAAPLPPMSSPEYAEAYNEVKAVGSATSALRTVEQSAIAKTYSGNFLAQYNRLFQDLAAAHLGGSSVARLGDRARLFALTNLAMADAFICAWDTKVVANFWRPVEAIRRGDEDGNAQTVPDRGWTTYFSRNFNAAQHPNYPEYTSGANNLTGAMTRMLALVFGSDKTPIPFGVHAIGNAVPLDPNPLVDPNPRMYTKFSDVAEDVIDARVYLGIHFRFADTEARSQGRRVAGYAFRHFLRPLN